MDEKERYDEYNRRYRMSVTQGTPRGLFEKPGKTCLVSITDKEEDGGLYTDGRTQHLFSAINRRGAVEVTRIAGGSKARIQRVKFLDDSNNVPVFITPVGATFFANTAVFFTCCAIIEGDK